MPPNEKDQFAQDTQSIVDQPLDLELKPTVEDGQQQDGTVTTQVDEEETPKNREARRLREKLQEEREANIDLAARLEVITEAQKFRQQTEPGEYLKGIERIYGTNSPEALEATELLKGALKGVEDRATTRALEQFREEQRQEAALARKESQRLDGFVDEIEDTYNVTLTADQRRGYFQLLTKMSPKDDEGNPTAWADPHAVYEVYKDKMRKPTAGTTAAKNISSRSMQQSGASQESQLNDTATVRALREAGILP